MEAVSVIMTYLLTGDIQQSKDTLTNLIKYIKVHFIKYIKVPMKPFCAKNFKTICNMVPYGDHGTERVKQVKIRQFTAF